MIIYYEKTNGQIRAIYQGDTTSAVWSDLGYTKAEVPVALEEQANMDSKVTLSNGEIIGFKNWLRPLLNVNKTSIIDDGVDIATITPSFLDGAPEACDWHYRLSGEGWVSAGKGDSLEFTSLVPGRYEIKCVSETFGISFTLIEVEDA